MGASESAIHPFCAMCYWFSFGPASLSEANSEVVWALDHKESCAENKCNTCNSAEFLSPTDLPTEHFIFIKTY